MKLNCLAASSLVVFCSAAFLSAADKTSPVAISTELAPAKLERTFTNLQFKRPIYLTYPADGTNRLAVMSQYGSVSIFPNDPNVEEAKELIDISHKVVYKDRENEEGLLGMAFHPNFKSNGQVFLYYSTTDSPHTSVLSRFHISSTDPNKLEESSEEEILRTPKKEFWNHNGGTIIFGPDGYLYIAIGDGGAANDPNANGQNVGTWLGKVLRIDVDHKDPGKNYAVPKDNPFVSMENAAPEVWALGLRNIWRMAFDTKTHKLWAGEVGQDTWEEIDIITKGGNYGWNIREGFHPFTTRPNAQPPKGPPPEKVVGELIDPIFEYRHDLGKSITGGSVYRGKQVPELFGAYMFADYVSGQVYALWYDEEAGKVKSVQPVGAPGQVAVVSFGTDEAGEMYVLRIAGATNGLIQRIKSGN